MGDLINPWRLWLLKREMDTNGVESARRLVKTIQTLEARCAAEPGYLAALKTLVDRLEEDPAFAEWFRASLDEGIAAQAATEEPQP